MRTGFLLITVMAGVAPAGHAQSADSLPPGVTAGMVEEGRRLFGGAAICASCHGKDAKGVRGIGPDLTDDEWLHSDGTYEALVRQITEGVPSDESETGVMMPPKGGTNLTEAQVRAVAAYVWSLRNRRT
jgi:mono/diheme cytochrome c family protein